MADFFRFFRQSKIRLQAKQQVKTKEKLTNNPRESDDPQSSQISRPQTNRSSNKQVDKTRHGPSRRASNYISCIHVAREKWEEVWYGNIAEKANKLQGLVFINPNFARTYYVPSCSFRCDFDSFNEYSQVNLESLAHMRSDQFNQWMKTFIQPSSCHVSMHCCQVVEILDRICVPCSNLIRISFHYFCLDDNVINYMNAYLGKLVSINFENSIGLTKEGFNKLGRMTNLLHLNLSGCDIYEESLLAILNSCQSLETLNISNNCALTGQSLAHMAVKNLKRLNIQDCWRIVPERLIEMVHFGLPNLIELACNSGINDQSLKAITSNCVNLIHLDISFEEFTYHDRSGMNCLTDYGFKSIGDLTHLKILRLRHVGRLTDHALRKILRSCSNLWKLTLNLRHRHKLTDAKALRYIADSCKHLMFFEAVHNHFIAKTSLEYICNLNISLQVLILRGNELIKDEDASMVIQKCSNLRYINLDGCLDVGHNTLACSVVHARNLAVKYREPDGSIPVFRASLVLTSIERSLLNSLASEFPENLHIRACNGRENTVHYNEFNGTEVQVYTLKEKFFPFYWYDYN